MARIDPHSYFDTEQPRARHVRLRWQVDFHTQQLTGDATLVFERPSSGQMENPRMTFLTPTVLAGDRSLVDVVAHELAHSWTGNLVTNATMEHFWLNEGLTTWAERRILAAWHGEDVGVLAWAIGQQGLDASIARFGVDSPLTRLRLQTWETQEILVFLQHLPRQLDHASPAKAPYPNPLPEGEGEEHSPSNQNGQTMR